MAEAMRNAKDSFSAALKSREAARQHDKVAACNARVAFSLFAGQKSTAGAGYNRAKAMATSVAVGASRYKLARRCVPKLAVEKSAGTGR
jgi:hypothetical protein